MGLINEKQQRYKEAKNYYIKALEINPTLWVAYEKLCKLGVEIKDMPPEKVFAETRYHNYLAQKKNSKNEVLTNIKSKMENEIIEEQNSKEHIIGNSPDIEQEPPMNTVNVLNALQPGKQKISQKKIIGNKF